MYIMSATKKALLVGINYQSIPSARLYGCINDIIHMSNMLVDGFDYDLSNIIKLRDDNSAMQPTKNNIMVALNNLVAQSANLTEIFFHYSGHGSQIRDSVGGDEVDGLDEIIVPLDFQRAGIITDDEIFNCIKNVKCRMILLFDSCSSGSICDLQYSFEYKNGQFLKTINSNKTIPSNPNIICFSGCKDNQTSADSYSVEESEAVGAFTDSFLKCIRVNHLNTTALNLYAGICNYCKLRGYTQTPILSCSGNIVQYSFFRENNTPIVYTTEPIVSSGFPNTTETIPTQTSALKSRGLTIEPATTTPPPTTQATTTNNHLIFPTKKQAKTISPYTLPKSKTMDGSFQPSFKMSLKF